MREWLSGLAAVGMLGALYLAWPSMEARPAPQPDPRAARLNECIVRIMTHLDDPHPDIPTFKVTPGAFHRDGNQEFFAFRSLNSVGGYDRRMGVCTFDAQGRLLRTNYDDQ